MTTGVTAGFRLPDCKNTEVIGIQAFSDFGPDFVGCPRSMDCFHHTSVDERRSYGTKQALKEGHMRRDQNMQHTWNDAEREFPTPILFFGVLAGSLIGAGVGLLFAPWSGATLRRRLRRYADRAVEDAIETGREALHSVVEQGREYVEDGMQAMSKMAKHAWR
jgi:hypothetical protein